MFADDLLGQRLRASALSRWELAAMLGIHPHHLGRADSSGGLAEQPTRVLIDLCRRLDTHPADVLPALDAVLTNHRAGTGERAEAAPDGMIVLAALAHSTHPLTVDELATVLEWSLDRTQEALAETALHPQWSGPMVLRHIPPHTYTVAARLDVLTPEQQQILAETNRYRVTLTADEAQLLLAVIAFGARPEYADYRAEYLDAEHALKLTGHLHSDDRRPDQVRITADVRYSLRLQHRLDR